jgi:hypothetical protein
MPYGHVRGWRLRPQASVPFGHVRRPVGTQRRSRNRSGPGDGASTGPGPATEPPPVGPPAGPVGARRRRHQAGRGLGTGRQRRRAGRSPYGAATTAGCGTAGPRRWSRAPAVVAVPGAVEPLRRPAVVAAVGPRRRIARDRHEPAFRGVADSSGQKLPHNLYNILCACGM